MKEMTLGRRIQKLRRAQSLTQESLAEILGITAQAVSKWENDLSCPDIMTLPQLCRELHVSIDTLLTGETSQTERVQIAKRPEELIIRIRFEEQEDDVRLGLNLPFTVFRLGARYGFLSVTYTTEAGEEIRLDSAAGRFRQMDLQAMATMVENGMRGRLFEYDEDGERLVIWTE